MNTIADGQSLEAAKSGGSRFAPWLAGAALGAAILTATMGGDALRQTFAEPDSAMRLVQVRDLLSGQAWFDTTQYRLNPPDGVPMHWARWVDGAIAFLIGVFGLIVGQANAEVLVAFLWPFSWLAAFVFLSTRIARELVWDDGFTVRIEWGAAVIAALAFPTLDRFAPGAFDHHNVVLVLCSLALWAILRLERDLRLGAVAGGSLALAVATAAEALPFLAIGAIVIGICWVLRPAVYARGLFWFGCAVVGVMALAFFAMVPPGSWASNRCDAMSTNFLWLGLGVGGAAMVLGMLPEHRWTAGPVKRFLAAVACAVAAGAGLAVLAPGCLAGGYGELSPEMRDLWMVQIGEARPLAQLLNDNVASFFALGGAGIAGLVFAALRLRQRPDFWPSWIAGAFLLGGVALMVWQVRGAHFASMFAIPFAAIAVVRAHAAYRQGANARTFAAFALTAVCASAAGWSVIGRQVQALTAPPAAVGDFEARQQSAEACFEHDVLGSLEVVPAGIILNQFAIGSGVLVASDHSVLAAPYHRNAEGMMAAINAFRSEPDAAREIVLRSRAEYILVCDGLPEAQFYWNHAAEGVPSEATLAYRLKEGDPPIWLEPVESVSSPLRLYRVRSEAGVGLRGRH